MRRGRRALVAFSIATLGACAAYLTLASDGRPKDDPLVCFTNDAAVCCTFAGPNYRDVFPPDCRRVPMSDVMPPEGRRPPWVCCIRA